MFRKIFLPVLYKAFQFCPYNSKKISDFASLLADLLPLFSTPLFPDHHNTFLVLFVTSFLGAVTQCGVVLSIQKVHSMQTSVLLNRLCLLCFFSLWATFIAHSLTFQLSLVSCSNWTLKYLGKIILLLLLWTRNKIEVILVRFTHWTSPSLDFFSLCTCSMLKYSSTNCEQICNDLPPKEENTEEKQRCSERVLFFTA